MHHKIFIFLGTDPLSSLWKKRGALIRRLLSFLLLSLFLHCGKKEGRSLEGSCHSCFCPFSRGKKIIFFDIIKSYDPEYMAKSLDSAEELTLCITEYLFF